jgi:hypothetical protein
MDKTTFKMLLEKVRPLIERQDTKLREAISAAEQLAVTEMELFTVFSAISWQPDLRPVVTITVFFVKENFDKVFDETSIVIKVKEIFDQKR